MIFQGSFSFLLQVLVAVVTSRPHTLLRDHMFVPAKLSKLSMHIRSHISRFLTVDKNR